MGDFGDAERRILAFMAEGTEFVFQEKNYKIILSGKPTCHKGEPKTDIYILAELSYDCKGQKRQKTHETGENTGYAGTVEMYQDGGTKLVEFNSWGLFEYEK